MIRQNRNPFRRERRGIGLDAELVSRSERQPSKHQIEQPRQLCRRQMSWRAAAKKESCHRLRLGESRQFMIERFEILVNEMILARDDSEIAVTTVMGAKGHVDISGTRPEPG